MRGSKKWCRNPDGRYKTAFGRRRIKNLGKCWIIWILTVGMMFSFPLRLSAANENLTISAPSAILIEKTTGSVLYEKEADTRRAPASVTKVMTMLLIMEEIAERRKYVVRGGEIDYERTAKAILDDFRKGRIGKITL